jgi:hypothetical protein
MSHPRIISLSSSAHFSYSLIHTNNFFLTFKSSDKHQIHSITQLDSVTRTSLNYPASFSYSNFTQLPSFIQLLELHSITQLHPIITIFIISNCLSSSANYWALASNPSLFQKKKMKSIQISASSPTQFTGNSWMILSLLVRNRISRLSHHIGQCLQPTETLQSELLINLAFALITPLFTALSKNVDLGL